MYEKSGRWFTVPLLLGALLAGTLASGCSWFQGNESKIRMNSSPEVPAARGTVRLQETRNGNTEIKISVQHLAEPDKIAANANTYVVWVRPLKGTDRTAVNIGALNVNGDLEGKLETVTPLRDFELFVTPESNPRAANPTGSKVLYTTVRKETYTTGL